MHLIGDDHREPCKRTVANMIYDLVELIYGRYLFNLYYVNIKGK